MENVRQILDKIHPNSDKDWDYFKSKFIKKHISKKTIILSKGQIESSLYFIEKGVLRAWIEKGFNDLTFDFCFENSFYSAYSSFITQTPCEYNIESISDITIWEVSYRNLQDIYKDTINGQLIGRSVAESLYISKTKRELSLLFRSPEQRYKELFIEHPRLIKEIPLKYIASFIGVTPQALSRIRKRIS